MMNNAVNINDRKSLRILGLDYGTKRVGVAVSDESKKFAMPVSVIMQTPELVVEIEKLAIDHEAGEIVLGESRDYKGEPNPIFDDTVKLKEELEALGFKVYFEPEYLTSAQAERLQGKNELLDASAAALILQSYLDKNLD